MSTTAKRKPAAKAAVLTAPFITCGTPGCGRQTLDDWSYASTWHGAVNAGWRTDATGQRRCPACADARLPSPVLYAPLPQEGPDTEALADASAWLTAQESPWPVEDTETVIAAYVALALPSDPASLPRFVPDLGQDEGPALGVCVEDGTAVIPVAEDFTQVIDLGDES